MYVQSHNHASTVRRLHSHVLGHAFKRLRLLQGQAMRNGGPSRSRKVRTDLLQCKRLLLLPCARRVGLPAAHTLACKIPLILQTACKGQHDFVGLCSFPWTILQVRIQQRWRSTFRPNRNPHLQVGVERAHVPTPHQTRKNLRPYFWVTRCEGAHR